MRSWFRVLVVLLIAASGNLTPLPAHANNNSFVDDDNSRFEPFIEKANAEGLIASCNPPANNRVCPHDRLTRGDLAVILARAIRAPAPERNHFTDDEGTHAEGAINALMDAGKTVSCGEGRFCPDRLVTRGEMATMIDKALGVPADKNPGEYEDLRSTRHREALAKLADIGGLAPCDSPVNQRLCPESTVARDEAIFAMVAALGLSPSRSSSADRALEPLGFGDGFHHLTLWDGRTPSARNNVALTPDGYRENGLRVRIPKGSHFGSDFHLHLDDAADEVPERLFFRYYLKFDSNWRTTTAGKLPGFSGVYGSTGKGGMRSNASEPGWSARLMFSHNSAGDSRVGLAYYVYHLGQERQYGDGLYWNEAGKLRPGEWYCLEGEVEMNTPGLADGALRGWVDETPALDASGLEFRGPNEPQIKIESFWFNVYYGGKPVALRDLGLTIDEVMVDTERIGCGAGQGLNTPADGDFNGDGYQDKARWEACPGGHCFVLEGAAWNGTRTTRHSGSGAWFSLSSHRLGKAAGDVDGDGRDDIVYHGRCEASAGCWRVHTARGGLETGENWGNGARFSPETGSLVLGDWNGDGLDDLLYAGTCGNSLRACWRVHTSSGSSFEPPGDWGTPSADAQHSQAVDLNQDGRDDIVFQAPCDESMCWFTQFSLGGSFGEPYPLGAVVEVSDAVEWIDFDGDGVDDLVSWVNTRKTSWIEVRYLRDGALASPVRVARFNDQVQGVAIRRRTERAPLQAIVSLVCKDNTTCTKTLMSPTPGRLVDSRRFLEELWNRPGSPEIS